MNPSLKLLFSSNIYKCPSGYGVQSASLMPRLAELPEFGGTPGSTRGRKNIAQFAWFGLHGSKIELDGFTIYPGLNDPYGNDVVGAHMRDFGANILISLIDVWVLRETAKAVAPALWLPWFPVDSDPVPPAVLNALDGAFQPLTYSRWGYDMLRKLGINNTYVPHGIEPDIYKVLPDRAAVADFKRRLTGVEGAHLTMGVWANKGWPNRKNPDGQLQAWARFAKDKPHARFYLHCEPTPVHGGPNILTMIADLGIADRVIFPDRYKYAIGAFAPEELAWVYNAADVYMGATMSEGFGIPLIEAQATGTPVIVTDFSSMPELVREGIKVPVAHRIWTLGDAWQVFPDEKLMQDALEHYHAIWLDNGREMPLAQRHKTSAAIHQEYSWDAIVKYHWAPLMTKLVGYAPPLKPRYQAPGVNLMPHDPVQDFVDTVNEGLTQASTKVEIHENSAPKPTRRVAPLAPVSPKEAHAIMDEVANDNISGALRSFDELRAAANGDGEVVTP